MKPFDRQQTAGQAEYEHGVLDTPEWAECRGIVLKRDGHQCRFCGCRDDLQVHHIDYTDLYNPDHCVTLCRTCHGHVTEAIRQAKEPISVRVNLANLQYGWIKNYLTEQVETYACIRLGEIIVGTLFQIWAATLNRDGASVQMRNPKIMIPVEHIVEQSIRGQTCLKPKGGPTFQRDTIERINEYIWARYAHYKAQGYPDQEIERFFKLERGRIRDIREHVARFGAGDDDSG